MTNWNLMVKRTKAGRHGRTGIAMHQNQVGLFLLQDALHPQQHPTGNLGQRLIGRHNL